MWDVAAVALSLRNDPGENDPPRRGAGGIKEDSESRRRQGEVSRLLHTL